MARPKNQPEETSDETVNRLLAAALSQLRRTGPLDFRIDELVRESGVSVGSIYHHFGDRSGLLRAAYVRAVEEAVSSDAQVLMHLAASCRSVSDVVEGLRALTRETLSESRREAREMRIEAMSLSRRDPLLREQIVRIQTANAEAHIEAFRELQRRGWMKKSVDPYMFALSITGNTLGTINDIIGPELLDADAWAEHTISLFASFALETED